MIQLKQLINEAGDFTAKSKESGKLVHFKSKDAYDKAIKAGSHEDPTKDTSKGGGKSGVNIFNTPTKSEPKSDGMATVNAIAAGTGLRAQAIAGWADENGVNLSKVAADLKSKKIKPMDMMTAVVGKPGNKYAKDIIAKYSQQSEPKLDVPKATPADLAVDKVVYNTRTKSVGIVRLPVERGEVKTDADGNVNVDELEPYNPMKYPHQKDAKVAPSTQKEVDARGLWNPFAPTGTEEPKVAEPKAPRKGDPTVNKEVRKQAQKLGITPEKLGKDEYQMKMSQAAIEALTDSNFHDEARALIASLEGKPEWAKKPTDMPSLSSPEYSKWRENSVYSSEYYDADSTTRELGTTASQAAGWSGDTAIDGIAFELRMNGFHKLADKIQSVIKEGKVNRTSLKNLMK
jgi:hypothetical protein